MEDAMIDKRQFYINGEWVNPHTPRDCMVIDPSTEDPCAVISLGSAADTDRAVAAGKAAFPAWAATPPARRAEYVRGILAQYEKRDREMAHAIALEMGAPIDMALTDQAACLPWHLKNFLAAFEGMEFIRPHGTTPGAMIALEPSGWSG
jgi:aldehyde dehydrogenase (NAD+)